MARTSKNIDTSASKAESKMVVEPKSTPAKKPDAEKPTKVWRPSEHMSERVPMRSAVYGTLIYVDTLSNRKWEWSEYGQRHELTLETLENARNTQPAFFINGWWEIDSSYKHVQEVLDFLDAAKFYQKEVSIDNFDALLRRSAEEVIAIVDRLPVAQKVSLARRAQDLINAGQLDSVSVIRALEKTLGTEFDF